MMPLLPEPALSLPAAAYKIEYRDQPLCPLYTESQLIQYGKQCIEAAADLVDHKAAPYGMPPDLESYWDTTCLALGDAIRNTIKGETK
jgi:hypothetical protein